MAETQNSEEYKYYMRARPLSIGTVPKGFTRFDEDDIGDKGGRYGAVFYDHPLSEKEVKSYELIPDRYANLNKKYLDAPAWKPIKDLWSYEKEKERSRVDALLEEKARPSDKHLDFAKDAVLKLQQSGCSQQKAMALFKEAVKSIYGRSR